jgi:uncharacterized delta-60 repeat protein
MLQASEWAFPPYAALALQGDGKFVVAIAAYLPQPKHSSTTDIGWEILRFNTNGSLDTTFGGSGTGKVTTAFTANQNNFPTAIAIQPTDGKIVVVGKASPFDLVRYTTIGTLDTSFGTGGEVATPIGAQDVAIDSLGRILVGGQASGQLGGSTVSALVRYNPNGTLDTSFGIAGEQTELPPGFSSARTFGLGLQSTGTNAGKIVISMEATGPSNPSAPSNQLALARLNPDGSLDGGFGSSGFYVESRMSTGGGLGPAGPILAIQPDDKLVLTGHGMSASANGSIPQAPDYFDFIVTRVLADGSSYDPAFGSAGLGQANLGGQSGPAAVTLAPDGKIVVTGQWTGSTEDFATARFLGDSASTTLVTSAAPTMTPMTAVAPSSPSLDLAPLVWEDPDFLASVVRAKRPHHS